MATDLRESTMKRFFVITVLVLGLTAPTVEPLAHHGWSWTTGGNIDLTGIIRTVRLGNPHGILTIDVEGDEWRAEVSPQVRFAGAAPTPSHRWRRSPAWSAR